MLSLACVNDEEPRVDKVAALVYSVYETWSLEKVWLIELDKDPDWMNGVRD